MPKISTKYIRVRNQDIDKGFDVVINYNKDFLFYAAIPIEFQHAVEHLTAQELKVLKIEMFRKSRADVHGYPIVSSASETGCEADMKKALDFLISKTIAKRNVIIVDFKSESYNRGIPTNPEHPVIGIAFSLTYAVESTSGENKVYSLYETYGDRVTRTEIYMHNRDLFRIIDDTPENRSALETLYKALNDLKEKLAHFTKDNNILLDFIQSNVKLLN